MGARIAALALLLALAAPPPPTALAATGARDCQPAAERVLSELGVDQAEVESLRLVSEFKGGEKFEQVLSVNAWVRLAGRPGQLVIVFSQSCTLRDLYTTGGLSLPGVDGGG